MRAVVHDRYGPPEVLRLEEVDRPVPSTDEVLVKVHATTLNRTDSGLRSAEIVISRLVTGLTRPKHRILGMELAGEVVEVGPAVTRFAVGDQVFGVTGFGAHAEFVCVRQEAALAHKPVNMTFEEAAAVGDGACFAMCCLRSAGLRAGQDILVYGASGSVGSAAVQLARHVGAGVTAVCNTPNVDLVRSLGADRVVDYLREDFTEQDERYDVIFDAVGKHSFRRSRRSLKPRGTFITTDLGYMAHAPFVALATSLGRGRRSKLGIARYTRQDILLLKELIEAGEYRAVIDRRYPLEEIIEATRYVESGQKVGNVVLTVTG